MVALEAREHTWTIPSMTGLPPSPGAERQPNLVADGQGGVFVAYIDQPNQFPTDKNIYAQHLDAHGNRLWGSGGVPVIGTLGEDALDYWGTGLVADGAGGVFVAFTHRLNPGKVRAQHLDVNGVQGGSAQLQKTVIPVTAEANLSIRLVAGQRDFASP